MVNLLCALWLLAATGHAHNWMHSTTRSYFMASTIKPCAERKSTDIHAQVGVGQSFIMKWAVGHGGKSYHVLLRGEDLGKVTESTYRKSVLDYLAKAPAGSDKGTSTDPNDHRYMGSRSNTSMYWNDYRFTGYPIDKTSALFKALDHPYVPNSFIYKFNTTFLGTQGDQRVEYESELYPWILAVHAFNHIDLPSDHNTALFKIPSYVKPGYYVYSWMWSGYYDCTDILVRADPVVNPYGLGGAGYVYSRIDHCEYVGYLQVYDQCLEAAVTVDNVRLDSGELRSTRVGSSRAGINVVVAQNPNAVHPAFRNKVNIPWNNPVCIGGSDQTQWWQGSPLYTIVPVSEKESSYDFSPASFGYTLTDASICATGTTGTGSFRQAVALCSTPTCQGLAFTGAVPAAGSALPDPSAKITYLLCNTTVLVGNSSYTHLLKIAPTAVPDADTTPWLKQVSFTSPLYMGTGYQKIVGDRTVPSGWVVDTGLALAVQGIGGDEYGWACNTSSSNFSYLEHPSGLVNTTFNTTRTIDVGNTYTSAFGMGYNANSVFVGNSAERGCLDPTTKLLTRNWWSIKVPANGVYRVTTFTKYTAAELSGMGAIGDEIHGCAVENVKLYEGGNGNPPPPSYALVYGNDTRPASGVRFTKDVEVLDGYLTVNAQLQINEPFKNYWYANEQPCRRINTITIEKRHLLGHPRAWHPTASSPWREQYLGSAYKSIGLVGINNYAFTNCAHGFLYGFDDCPGSYTSTSYNRAYGWFNKTDQAWTVRVSNTSCAGVAAGQNCPGVVCDRIPFAPSIDREFMRYTNCKGVVGLYVTVQAPGASRILPALDQVMQVNSAVPLTTRPLNETLVAYGVQPVLFSAVTPEYVITYDPEDPKFYSSCYVRETNITWLDQEPPKPNTMWRFPSGCASCSAVDSNIQSYDLTVQTVPTYHLNANSAKCAECEREKVQPYQVTKLKWGPLTRNDVAFGTALSTSKCNTSLSGVCLTGGCGACRKQLQVASSNRAGKTVSLEECQVLAERDPDCQPYVEWAKPVDEKNVSKWRDLGPMTQYTATCACYRKDQCCGNPTPVNVTKLTNQSYSANFGTLYTLTRTSIWTADWTTPDPQCTSGTKSLLGTYCCPLSCVSSTGFHYCNDRNDTTYTVAKGFPTTWPFGICTLGANLGNDRLCSVTGPPCKLTTEY